MSALQHRQSVLIALEGDSSESAAGGRSRNGATSSLCRRRLNVAHAAQVDVYATSGDLRLKGWDTRRMARDRGPSESRRE